MCLLKYEDITVLLGFSQKCSVLNRVWVQELGPGGSNRLLWQNGEAHGSEVAQTFTVRKGPGEDL